MQRLTGGFKEKPAPRSDVRLSYLTNNATRFTRHAPPRDASREMLYRMYSSRDLSDEER